MFETKDTRDHIGHYGVDSDLCTCWGLRAPPRWNTEDEERKEEEEDKAKQAA